MLLPDGRILLAGGAGPEGAVASAEIFDDTAAFVAAAPMNVARTEYASVVLHDGRVLVSGGLTDTGEPTNTAEVYDAASNTWRLVGTMSHPRYGHTASRLSAKQDGLVVVAGGDDTENAPGSIELFDPVFNSFFPAGNLSSDRRDHSAVVLADDRVLFVGGSAEETALATIDVYDSGIGAVSTGPALSSARTDASATVLLDGTVLIAGGRNESGDLGSAELYNPLTNTLATAESSLLVPRSGHSAVKLPHNNNVLFIGGSSGGTALDSCELYVPWLDQFKPASQLIDARVQASGTPLNVTGLLLVSGGRGVATAEVYGFATIRTDKDDYAPYTWVEITGAGFGPGETVLNEVEQIVGPGAGDIYDAWEIPANESGGFFTSWLVFSEDLLNTTLQLTSTGTSTGLSARTTFTDGAVKVQSNSSDVSFDLDFEIFANQATCGNIPSSSGTDFDINEKGINKGVANADSILLTAAEFSNESPAQVFLYWTFALGKNTPAVLQPITRTYCAEADSVSNRVYTAHYGQRSVLTVQAATGVYGNTTALQATLQSGTTALSNKSVNFKLNDTSLGSATTDVNGVATLSGVSIAGINASTYADAVVATFATDGTYGSSSGSNSLTVTPKPVTGSFTAANKVYEATSAATFSALALTGVISGDAVSLTGSSATFTDKNVGTAKTVTLNDASLSGASAGNYSLTTPVTSKANITAKPASVTPAGASKIYGSADPALTGSTSGFLAADNVTASYSRSTGETVAGGPYTISATLSPASVLGNYAITYRTALFTITKADATIKVDGYAGVYDGAAHGATVTATGVAGEALAGLDLGDSFTNVPGGTATWTFTDVTGNYNDASGEAAIVIGTAQATVTPSNYSGTYDAAEHTASVTITGVGGVVLASESVKRTNAGSDSVTASTSDSNYEPASGTATIDIAKADAAISVTGYIGVYDGAAHGATGTATGVAGEALTGLGLGDSFTNVPGGTATWTYTGGTNYKDESGSVEIAISKASSTTVVTIVGGPFTYTGAALTPATVSVSGAGGLDLTPTAGYANNTNAGTATASYSYAGDDNHEASSDSKTFDIAKANTVISVSGYTGVYDGAAHGATGTAVGVEAAPADLNSLLHLGGKFTNVPGGTANWTFDGNDNYNAANGSVQIVISKATLTVSADAKSRCYGVPDPVFTATISGFKNNETLGTSGVMGAPNLSTVATNSSTIGGYQITAAIGTLAAANYSFNLINGVLTITPGYVFDGFMPPIGGCVEKGTGGSQAAPLRAFKLGSTVPVKFRLTSECGAVVNDANLVHTLRIYQCDNKPSTALTAIAVATDAATEGNRFRPTSVANSEWHFNLDTKALGLTAGTWRFEATLQDGSKYNVYLDLKK